MDDRLEDPRMDWYKSTYKNSERVNCFQDVSNKHIVVYGEQGFGDIIQFARYIPELKSRCKKVTFHCPKDLHQIFQCFDVDLLDKDESALPNHDAHILSFDLPFVLQLIEVRTPYIHCEEIEVIEGDDKKVGIVWEGSSNHPNASNRDCPLHYFKMFDVPGVQLFSLQKHMVNQGLLKNCEDMNLYSVKIENFYDTAKLINAMDIVISIDTSVLHLAGAMNKTTFAILSKEHDSRWDAYHWYDRMICVRQNKDNDWPACFQTVANMSNILST